MRLLSLLSAILLSACVTGQNTVCFDIEANPYPNDPALSGFTKYVNVYGFEIFGESGISDAQVLHVAAVTAELLDNDEDGTVDDQALLTQLIGSGALMPMFNNEGSAMENTFFNNYNGDGVSAVLYGNEVDPTQPGHWGDDATVEEILHTINHVGHSALHPTIFGFTPNSSVMSAAMDTARGVQWLTIPNPYPAEAWYHYDDVTCDYGCMAIEYIYWSIVSNMGILDDPQTCSGIANEWEPCSPALFQSTDVAMYNLITDPQHKLPQNAPDGNYCPAGTGIDPIHVDRNFTLISNLAVDLAMIDLKETSLISIFDLSGKLVFTKEFIAGTHGIDVSSLNIGVYLVKSDSNTERLVIQR